MIVFLLHQNVEGKEKALDKPSLKIFCVDMTTKRELEIESKTQKKRKKKVLDKASLKM